MADSVCANDIRSFRISIATKPAPGKHLPRPDLHKALTEFYPGVSANFDHNRGDLAGNVTTICSQFQHRAAPHRKFDYRSKISCRSVQPPGVLLSSYPQQLISSNTMMTTTAL